MKEVLTLHMSQEQYEALNAIIDYLEPIYQKPPEMRRYLNFLYRKRSTAVTSNAPPRRYRPKFGI
jgi:hypothetical protein